MIVANGSLTILLQYFYQTLALFVVSKDVLVQKSEYFRALLAGGFAESSQETVTIQGQFVSAFELWLRYFHDTLTEESYNLGIKDVYHAIALGNERLFEVRNLKGWFEKWWDNLE